MHRFLNYLLVLMLATASAVAQYGELWSVNFTGGDFEEGYIFKLDEEGDNLEIVHHFDGGSGGGWPVYGLTDTGDDVLYGITTQGGDNGLGVLYSISKTSLAFEVLHHFDTGQPYGTVIQASNGKLYGCTSTGSGEIYEFDLEMNNYTILHTFDRTGGRLTYLNNTMIEESENVLFGFTERGGEIDAGVLYKYDINTSTYEVVFEFDADLNGRFPTSIHKGEDGLYGMTSSRDQRIFTFDASTNQFTTVFELPDLSIPNPGILLASDGNYYGTTSIDGVEGHGSIFRVNPSTQEFTTIHSFLEFSGPHIPDVNVIEAINGKLYGTTRYVSIANAGTSIYEYDLETETFAAKSQLAGGLSISQLTQLGCSGSYAEVVDREACVSYTFNEEVLSTTGQYQATFLSMLGCDSLVTLNLTIFPEEECDEVVLKLVSSEISVYPNPTYDGLINLEGLPQGTTYQIVDSTGREILSGTNTNKEVIIDGASGIYFLKVVTPEGTFQMKIIKAGK